MYFVGVDLAWGETKPSGIAVLDESGDLVAMSPARGDPSVHAVLEPWVAGDCLVAIDAPLIVKNPGGNRPCEAALNDDFRDFDAGAHPTNTGRKEFKETPRGARIADALDLDIDPASRASRRAIEVYPHPATVVLFRLGRTIKYKQKKKRTIVGLQSELLRLITLTEGLAAADVSLQVMGHAAWVQVRRLVEQAATKAELRRAEDQVDAVLCAYIARYATERPDDIKVYGDIQTGYIVTPSLPSDLRPEPRRPTTGLGPQGNGTVHPDLQEVRRAAAALEAARMALIDSVERFRALGGQRSEVADVLGALDDEAEWQFGREPGDKAHHGSAQQRLEGPQ
jgi:predicted RNase H-like nuclease